MKADTDCLSGPTIPLRQRPLIYPLLRDRRRPRIKTKTASWVFFAPTLEAMPLGCLAAAVSRTRATKEVPLPIDCVMMTCLHLLLTNEFDAMVEWDLLEIAVSWEL